MMIAATLLLTGLLSPSFSPPMVDACTAILVGRKASAEGGTINTHTDDCYDCDFRIARIPSQTHDLSVTPDRAIPPMRFSFPRYVGTDRGPVFFPSNTDNSMLQSLPGSETNMSTFSSSSSSSSSSPSRDSTPSWPLSPAVGFIPQVSRTYSYIDGSYAISNEYGLSLGESTCGSRLFAAPSYDGGRALLELAELGRIALERCRTAREAIELMGSLAVRYGYFSSEWRASESRPDDFSDARSQGGETYTIADPFEVWVMHLSPDDTGASAVWVAQRVPDDHIFVVTNGFRIRTVPPMEDRDPDWFRASENIFTIAKRAGLWNEENDGPLDFKLHYGLTLSPQRDPYVSRRAWRVLSLAAPSLGLPGNSTSSELPFSVKPERLLSVQDIRAMNRDHFEGTIYDTTIGPSSGPFGNPNRFDAYGGRPDAPKVRRRLHDLANASAENEAMSKHQIHSQIIQTQSHPLLSESLLRSFSLPKSALEVGESGNFGKLGKNINANEVGFGVGIGPGADEENIDRSMGAPLSDEEIHDGHFERTISLFRTSYSHVTRAVPTREDAQRRIAELKGRKAAIRTEVLKNGRALAQSRAFLAAMAVLHDETQVNELLATKFDFNMPLSLPNEDQQKENHPESSSLIMVEGNVENDISAELEENQRDLSLFNYAETTNLLIEKIKRDLKKETGLSQVEHSTSVNADSSRLTSQSQRRDDIARLRRLKTHGKQSQVIPPSKLHHEFTTSSSVPFFIEETESEKVEIIADSKSTNSAKSVKFANKPSIRSNRTIALHAAKVEVNAVTADLLAQLRKVDELYQDELAESMMITQSLASTLPKEISYVSFISMHQPKTSVYVPFFPAAIPDVIEGLETPISSISTVPPVYAVGSLFHFSQDSLWWITSLVSNYAQQAWRFIIRDIEAFQGLFEAEMEDEMTRLSTKLASNELHLYSTKSKNIESSVSNDTVSEENSASKKGKKNKSIAAVVNNITKKYARKAYDGWWSLFWHLAGRYHDGYSLDTPYGTDISMSALFYPTWWLESVRYWRQPEGDKAKTPSHEKDALHFPPSFGLCDAPSFGGGLSADIVKVANSSNWFLIISLILMVILSALVGAMVDRCFTRPSGYEAIPTERYDA